MNSTRPQRKAAIAAKIRIHELLCKNHEDYEKVTVHSVHVEQHNEQHQDHETKQCMTSSSYINMLVREAAKTNKTDEKSALVTRVFRHILENPVIVTQNPKFGVTVYNKIMEIKDAIRRENDRFASVDLSGSLTAFAQNLHKAMPICNMNSDIQSHLDHIQHLIEDYKEFMPRTGLLHVFEELKPIMPTPQ